MPDALELEPRIAAVFASKLHVQIPSSETDLITTGLVDSLTFVQVLAQLEQEFDIHVSFEDLELDHIRSIARIARFVATKIQNGAGNPV